jgi:hypothetical protein
MAAIHPAEEPTGPTVVPPDEALRRALPVPSDRDLVIEGLTVGEWVAFGAALTQR